MTTDILRTRPDAALGHGVAHAAGVVNAAGVIPRDNAAGVRVRAGTAGDVPFLDAQQKAHARELGFLPRMALTGKLTLGQVLIAEVGPAHKPTPLGYLIAADRYQKRDEIGFVTQLCVVPGFRRSLVAASLLQHQFDRSAYGCRLYACWCAQDLAANAFWESMGFAAIAFRTGSRSKGKNGAPRIHIFWQKRIRPGDESTPWWYPSTTGGGVIREDRLVFPIPPGVGWRDVLPAVLPETPAPGDSDTSATGARDEADCSEVAGASGSKAAGSKKPAPRLRILRRPRGPQYPGALWFLHDEVEVVEQYLRGIWTEISPVFDAGELPQALREQAEAYIAAYDAEQAERRAAKKRARERQARTPDGRLVTMARELRDRWTEAVAAGRFVPDLRPIHDVRRGVGEHPAGRPGALPDASPRIRTLPAAA